MVPGQGLLAQARAERSTLSQYHQFPCEACDSICCPADVWKTLRTYILSMPVTRDLSADGSFIVRPTSNSTLGYQVAVRSALVAPVLVWGCIHAAPVKRCPAPPSQPPARRADHTRP